MRKFDFNVGGRNLEGRLKERVCAQRERINEILDNDRIVTILKEKNDYIKRKLGFYMERSPAERIS